MSSDSTTAHKAPILGVPFDLVDQAGAIAVIDGWRRDGRRHCVAIVPPHSVMCCRRDEAVRRAILKAEMALPDGIGIIMAMRILGYPHRGRVTGPGLMLALCDWGRSRGYRHYFYGGEDGVAEAVAERLGRLYPGLEVAGTFSPPFRPLTPEEDAAIVERVSAARPDIVWIGLGAPKQELWMAEHEGRIAATAMIGVGAAFDFHAGRVRWAPPWIRKAGLEWAYRLLQQPRRLWRRNLDNPLFLLSVIGQRLGRKRREAL